MENLKQNKERFFLYCLYYVSWDKTQNMLKKSWNKSKWCTVLLLNTENGKIKTVKQNIKSKVTSLFSMRLNTKYVKKSKKKKYERTII